eukprot:COSAG01_NODE_8585_length_2728_cov_14.207684_2_plen_198_part_00
MTPAVIPHFTWRPSALACRHHRRPSRSPSPSPSGLPGRVQPQLRDRNRRDIGKSQSQSSASQMEHARLTVVLLGRLLGRLLGLRRPMAPPRSVSTAARTEISQRQGRSLAAAGERRDGCNEGAPKTTRAAILLKPGGLAESVHRGPPLFEKSRAARTFFSARRSSFSFFLAASFTCPTARPGLGQRRSSCGRTLRAG